MSNYDITSNYSLLITNMSSSNRSLDIHPAQLDRRLEVLDRAPDPFVQRRPVVLILLLLPVFRSQGRKTGNRT
jgi:hypothetical protein